MIGVFDSGIGGLTVVRALSDALPGRPMIYFGDTARTPYGNKSPRTIIEYALEDTKFLAENGATLIVVACNSAASVAVEAIEEAFDLPVFEVIKPAAEMAVAATRFGRIGVIGTRATIQSGTHAHRVEQLAPGLPVFGVPCPLLVPLVEEGWLKKPETAMIVKKYLIPLKARKIDTLILGCTHYPVLAGLIGRKMGRRVTLIDSAAAVAASVKGYLETGPAIGETAADGQGVAVFVSDRTEAFERTARMILGRTVRLTEIRP